MPQNTSNTERQSAHYDAILGEYDDHYGDAASLRYRDRFFMEPLLDGLDLDGLDIADLASGSGHTTTLLKARFPRARIVGFDVAEQAVRAYRQRTGCECSIWDLTTPPRRIASFDVAVVVGGLHHCAASVGSALENIACCLRPHGLLLMVEPSRDTWWESARRAWYRRDHYFEASTEAALSHQRLLHVTNRFECMHVRYMGGPAYFLVYNSLVFRLPPRLKAAIAAPLMAIEPWVNKLPTTRAFPYFVAQWRLR
jgi:SAM-dependent methyltransferase